MNSKIFLYNPSINSKEKTNVIKCLKDNWISSKGNFINKFEKSFKKKFSYKYATVTTNGTTALHLALLALDIKNNEEVIVPNLTYVAPVNSVSYVGGKQILVDVDKDTWLMNYETIIKNITKKTKAIILVHLYGFAYDHKMINLLKYKHNLKIIEDCAEAIGTKSRGKYVGSSGDVSTFSFYGNKTITTGEGGMVIANQKKIINKIIRKKFKSLNINKNNNFYNHEIIGYNYRMTNICAAIGLAQLKKIDFFINRKKKINTLYKNILSKSPVEFQKPNKFVQSTYWLVNIKLKSGNLKRMLAKHLKEKNVETRPIFKPMNRLEMYNKLDKNFYNSIDISNKGISLPSYPDIKDKKIKFIGYTIKKFLEKKI